MIFYFLVWTFFLFRNFTLLLYSCATPNYFQCPLSRIIKDTIVISMIWSSTRKIIILFIYPCINKSINQLLNFVSSPFPHSSLDLCTPFILAFNPFLAQTPPGASVVHKSLRPYAMSSLSSSRLKPRVLGLFLRYTSYPPQLP